MSRFSVAVGEVQAEAVKEAFDALREEFVSKIRADRWITIILFVLAAAAFLFLGWKVQNSQATVFGYEQRIRTLDENVAGLTADLRQEQLFRIRLENGVQGLRDTILMPLAPKPAPTATPISGPWYHMVEVSKPDWLTYKDDKIVVSGGLTASVVWIDSRTWVEVEIRGRMKPIASIGPDDLILISRGSADKLEDLVYLNVGKDKTTWYRPKGVGNSYDNLQLVAAVWLSPSADGISPWAYARGDVSPYVVGEKVFVQEGARSASFK